jgi:hypothetical protein
MLNVNIESSLAGSLLSVSATAQSTPDSSVAKHLVFASNSHSTFGCWEAEHVIGASDKENLSSRQGADPRFYPKSHDCYDLAPLTKWPMLNSSQQVSKKSAIKYDKTQVGLLRIEGMKERIARFEQNKILPDFIHNFFTLRDDPKFRAFQKNSEQFPATTFTQVGGMMLMPNVRHIEGYPEVFSDPMTLTERTRNTAGYALVGYWVPPNVFEGREPFYKLFGSNSGAGTAVRVCETVSEYNKRTNTQFIVNLIDVRKRHQPMLQEFKSMSLKHLKEVYGFRPDKDNVQMFLHGPLYGDATAGLHVHVRVNQSPAAGEADTNILGLDKLLSVLQDDAIPDSPRCQGSCRVPRFLKSIPGAARVWSCLSTQKSAKLRC